MNNSKIKVLYIAGSGRSGSTILHNILGQIDRFTAIGELHHIWRRGFSKNGLCGCGVPFLECEMWRTVVNEAFGGSDQVEIHKMGPLAKSYRIYQLPFVFVSRFKRSHASRLSEFLDTLEKLYRAIQTTTNSKVIVDSSKTPVLGYLLRMIPAIELYVVHLIRDSRAVAYSWSRKKAFQPNTTKPEYHQLQSIRSSLYWNARNSLTEIYLRQTPVKYLMLRYEDFVERPQESVQRILVELGETTAQLPFVAEHEVEIRKSNHSIFGNLVRFHTGTVELKVDDMWRTKMNRQHQFAVMTLTWPLLFRYGYL